MTDHGQFRGVERAGAHESSAKYLGHSNWGLRAISPHYSSFCNEKMNELQETSERGRARLKDDIFFIEQNIHGAWVIYGAIGVRQYYGYSKRAAQAKYR